MFNVMHVGDAERVEIQTYQTKNISRTWDDKWKEGKDEDAPHLSWAYLKKLFWGVSFPEN